jgi:glycosyltransferase involved in cell wall biosynthesis
MRLAFFLDNRGIAARGTLPDPRLGNPGIGGTEYAFLAVVALLQNTALEPLLLITDPQAVAGLDPARVAVVVDLSEALQQAWKAGALALVLRPGAMASEQWRALEASPLPLVAWLHNLGLEQQVRWEGLVRLSRWVLVSGAQLDHFRHSRLAKRAVVIPNPVAVPPAARRPRGLEGACAAQDLAYVGALTPFKGFDRLAAGWGRIAEACPTARLRVFGAADLYGQSVEAAALTPYERHCRHLLKASGHVERVLFEGSCGLERYEAYSAVAVGVVNPSGRDETFCLSAAEFSACGIPVVTARRHALVQTVRDGRTGLLAGSDRQLADHCITLLRDPALAWRLGEAGQAQVSAVYGPATVVRGWLQLAAEIQAGFVAAPPPPSTPWQHEQRWLRQLWGALLMCPVWPSWPSLKASLKRRVQGGEQAIGPRFVALLAGCCALLLWAGLVFGKYGGNPTGLARIGDQLPHSPLLKGQPLVVLQGKRGNDGQQFLTLALDPLQLEPGSSAALDNPIYRGKRLLYPLLAWLLGLGQPALIPWTLGLVNVALVGWAAGLVARWAELEQRSPRWGLGVLALPATWITLSFDTADLLATSLLLGAGLAWRQRRPGRLGASLSAALLSRETALLGWAATGWALVWERRWRWLLPLLLLPVPLLAWTLLLRQRFGATADGLLASLHFGWPGLGLARKAAQLLGWLTLPGPPPGAVEQLFDGLCFLLWLATLAVLLVTVLRPTANRWLRAACSLYLLPALCTSTQILARFPDYTRVWIDLSSLALLALLSARSSALQAWVLVSALLSAAYGVGYALAP